MAVEAAPRDFRFICLLEDGDMELFLGFVGIMVILALIRLWNGPKDSKGQMMGSNEHMHYWIPPDPGTSDGGGGIGSDSMESGGGSFDGGGSDGGGGDSSGF